MFKLTFKSQNRNLLNHNLLNKNYIKGEGGCAFFKTNAGTRPKNELKHLYLVGRL